MAALVIATIVCLRDVYIYSRNRARIVPKFWHTYLVDWKFCRAIFDVRRPQTSLYFVRRMSVDGQLICSGVSTEM